ALRLATLEDRIDADLAGGRHAEPVGELETLVASHPHRERLRRHLMHALYRSRRHAEALQAIGDARSTPADLGTQPSAELRELENFEQVAAAGPAVARLVTETSSFLITSRAPLKVAAEREYPVPTLTPTEAHALFVERARAVNPKFEPTPSVSTLCRRLDFLP